MKQEFSVLGAEWWNQKLRLIGLVESLESQVLNSTIKQLDYKAEYLQKKGKIPFKIKFVNLNKVFNNYLDVCKLLDCSNTLVHDLARSKKPSKTMFIKAGSIKKLKGRPLIISNIAKVKEWLADGYKPIQLEHLR